MDDTRGCADKLSSTDILTLYLFGGAAAVRTEIKNTPKRVKPGNLGRGVTRQKIRPIRAVVSVEDREHVAESDTFWFGITYKV